MSFTDVKDLDATMRLLVCLVVVVAGSLSLLACGPKVRGLQQDPTFTYESLTADEIGVGGTASLVRGEGELEATDTQLSNMLHGKLGDVGRGYDAMPTGVFVSKLGDEVYNATLDAFRLTGTLNSETLDIWQAAVLDMCRYVIFARVENDYAEQYLYSPTEGDYIVHTYSTKRTLTIAFVIYDLQLKRSVWSANLNHSETNKNEYKEKRSDEDDEDESTLETVGRLLGLGDSKVSPTYPDPPALSGLAGTIFKGFANELPKMGEN